MKKDPTEGDNQREGKGEGEGWSVEG